MPKEDDDRLILLSNLGVASDEVEEDDGGPKCSSQARPEPSGIIYVAATVAAVGGLLFGYDMGVISGAKIQLQRDLGLSCAQLEWTVTLLPLGALFASLVGGWIVDHYGRKRTILANAFLFTVGALMVSLSRGLAGVLLGRFILGYAVSLSAIAECIYISEISTADLRGRLVSLNELAITCGILLSFLANFCLAEVPQGWRVMFALSTVPAVVQALATIPLPKTPYYLMLSGQDSEAERVLKKLRLTSNVRRTMADIRLSINASSNNSKAFFNCHRCKNGDDRDKSTSASSSNMGLRFTIGIGLVFFQQFTGQPNMIYYAADVFRQVGFCSEISSALASVGLGVTKVVATVICLSLIDHIGRRKALLIGLSIMGICVSFMSLATFFDVRRGDVFQHQETCEEIVQDANSSYNLLMTSTEIWKIADRNRSTSDDHDNAEGIDARTNLMLNQSITHQVQSTACGGSDAEEASNSSFNLRYVVFLSLVGFVSAYSFSFGPVTWLVLSEIFPPSTKGRDVALVTSFNWLGNFVVSATFLQASSKFSLEGIFLIYAIMCAFAAAFVYWLLPETRNKTLEEISTELSRSKPDWSRSCCCCL